MTETTPAGEAKSALNPSKCSAFKLDSAVVELLEVRWAMVQHPLEAPRVLHQLEDEDSLPILIRMAEHGEAHPDTLTQLAQHSHPDVRAAVGDNVHAPFTVLTRLVNDESIDVRFRLAENPHVPLAHLEALSEDENPYVAMRAQKTLARIESSSFEPMPMPRLCLFESDPTANPRSRSKAREAI